MNDSLSKKEAHEQFVSGHGGTTVTEIAVLATLAPVTVFLRNVFCASVLGKCRHASVYILVDFVFLMLPLILCCTVLADVSTAVLTSLLVIVGLLLSTQLTRLIAAYSRLSSCESLGKQPWLTNYRGYVNAASAICILAVDFQIFPRRLCKTETFGSGLMDVGVASYVFSNAIVSPEARGRHSNVGALNRVVNSIKSTAPLIVLGFCRLISVKAADYQEHVTEYGVHWNFFFTLVVIRVLSTVLYCLINARYSWLMSLVLITVYEIFLSSFGLRDYVLNNSTGRSGFIAANREGIFSSIGYLALYLSGVQLGCFIFRPRSVFRDWSFTLGMLTLVAMIFWILHFATQPLLDAVSRRLTNMSYCIWMVAYNIQSLASFLFADLLHVVYCESLDSSVPDNNKGDARKVRSRQDAGSCHETETSTNANLLEAINFNGLLYFLLANLLTGAVNMTTVTMNATTLTALTELTVYMFVLTIVVTILRIFNFSVKFW